MAYWSPWGSINESTEAANYYFEEAFHTGLPEYTDGCNLPEGGTGIVSLYNKPNGSVLFNSLNSGVDIGGFQLEMAGATITAALGGAAEDAEFTISNSATMVLGFSLTGTVISEGCGTLIWLGIEGTPSQFSRDFTNIILSDGTGAQVDYNFIYNILRPDDWVGIFKDGKCVGAKQWDTAGCVDGICSVQAGGDDGQDLTNGYMTTNDIPTFKIYDTKRDIYYNASTSGGTVDPWEANGQFSYDYLTATNLSIYYDLHYGVNLVSFPQVHPNSSIPEVFGCAPNTGGTGCHGIFAINNSGNSASWHEPSQTWNGSLMNMNPLDGVWVHVSDDVDFEIEGDFLENPTYSVYANTWSLISYPGHESMYFKDAFPPGALTTDGVSGIVAMNDEGSANMWEGQWIGSLTLMRPKRGYWIRSYSDFSFQFNLETTAQCSQLEYTTEAGCTGAGYVWRQMLLPSTGG
jgi:hypothetical protein